MQGNTKGAGDAEPRPEADADAAPAVAPVSDSAAAPGPDPASASASAWRWDLDDEDTPVVLRHPPGLEQVATAFEWYFDGLVKAKDVMQNFLPVWHRLLAENGPDYSLSTNSAGAIRKGPDTVELSSNYEHFEPIVISNALFEEVVASYRDFAVGDDRFE